jgi:threonine dehydratase
MIPANWIEEAAQRIAPYIQHTSLTYSPEDDLFIKWENHQVTGSFKARGAFNKVLCLQPQEKEKGLVAASAGNHGQGVALAGKLVGAQVTIFASDHAVPAKIEAMQNLGAKVVLIPGGYGEAEAAGIDYAQQNDQTWISPYNDEQVIAGQGTLGLEIERDLPRLRGSTWIVPAGGGGLVAGVGASLDQVFPRPKLIAVQSEASPFMHAIYHTGTQENIIELPSLADGLAGPVEAGSITIPLIRQSVDEFVLVREGEISRAIAYCWEKYHEKIEGSAATALAAALYGKVPDRPAVIVISGGNIQPEQHQRILENEHRHHPG